MAVKIIKAKKKQEQSSKGTGSAPILRVAAYCRVSTDSDEQDNSYEAQKTHYEFLINSHKDWTNAGIFADFGISGTSAKNRVEFMALIEKCKNREIDVVLTKSISRFSRNTVDCLKYVRLLKELSIPVIFEKENINTMEASGEILITILASISQQESQSISENIRIGIQYNFQQGKGLIGGKYFFGYDLGSEPHTVVINPEQARVVRQIFRMYLEGLSPSMIARQLNEKDVPTASGKGRWYDTTIRSILTNEKHCGDLLLQKYYVKSFLDHKLVKNNGDRQQYFVEDDHDPIVPKEIFYQTQGELRRRSFLSSDPNRVRYGSTDSLLGRVFCGKCGTKMRRFKKKVPDWRCEKRVVPPDTADRCDMEIIKEDEIRKTVVAAFNRIPSRLPALIRAEESIHSGEIKSIDAMIRHLTEDEERFADLRDADELSPAETERMAELENEKNSLFHKRAELANRLVLIRDLREFAEGRKAIEDDGGPCSSYEDFFNRTCYEPPAEAMNCWGEVIVFDNGMVLRFVESVKVLPDRMVVKFKAGVEIEIERKGFMSAAAVNA